MSARATMLSLIFLTLILALVKNSSDKPPRHGAVAASINADAPRVVEDSMHEFMEYVFQPTYRRLKMSMASEPVDSKAWKPIKSDALILAESCNLLFARTPDDHAADWNRHAVASREAGAELYKAAREKDFDVATKAYGMMLQNCNACHKQFEDGRHILTP